MNYKRKLSENKVAFVGILMLTRQGGKCVFLYHWKSQYVLIISGALCVVGGNHLFSPHIILYYLRLANLWVVLMTCEDPKLSHLKVLSLDNHSSILNLHIQPFQSDRQIGQIHFNLRMCKGSRLFLRTNANYFQLSPIYSLIVPCDESSQIIMHVIHCNGKLVIHVEQKQQE